MLKRINSCCETFETFNKTENYSVSIPSRDALEFIDKHELYILSLPKVPQGILSVLE